MQINLYVYGCLGADENYRVARYAKVSEEIKYMFPAVKEEAAQLILEYPSIKECFAIPAGYGLRLAYIDAFKRNSMEGWIEFRDVLERDGMKVNFD